jgi:hypothetical protein
MSVIRIKSVSKICVVIIKLPGTMQDGKDDAERSRTGDFII